MTAPLVTFKRVPGKENQRTILYLRERVGTLIRIPDGAGWVVMLDAPRNDVVEFERRTSRIYGSALAIGTVARFFQEIDRERRLRDQDKREAS